MYRSSISQVLLASSIFLASARGAFQFTPQTGGLQVSKYVDPLPTQYSLSASQAVIPANLNSFWSSSYIYGSNNHQYLILSNTALLPSGFGFYRASILDITDPSYFGQYTTIANVADLFLSNRTSGFDVEFGDYAYSTTTADPLGPIRTWSTNPAAAFNITIELSTPVILDGGLGTYSWESPIITNEWSMPAGHTTGTLTLNNSTITIDPSRSLTWYDRQWGPGSVANFTWFQIHLNTGHKLSTQFFPSGSGTTNGFASVRSEEGVQKVIPATYTESGRHWTSPRSGVTYALDWTIELVGGEVYEVSSVRDDQEVVDPELVVVVYDGFVSVSATKGGVEEVVGFGVVEVLPYRG